MNRPATGTVQQLAEDDISGAWGALGTCGQVGGDLWFSEDPEVMAWAKNICNTVCPVRDICRSKSVPNSEQYGVFGGLDHVERRQQPGYALRPLVDEFLPPEPEAATGPEQLVTEPEWRAA